MKKTKIINFLLQKIQNIKDTKTVKILHKILSNAKKKF